MNSLFVGRGRLSYRFGATRGGLVHEVGVGGFLVVFCGGGWTLHIVWQWY